MTIYNQTAAVLAKDDRIPLLYQQASPGDRSILPMMLDREDSVGSTSADSPNDRLWSCFAEHGWMEPSQGGAPLPGSRGFRLTEAGRRALPVLLALLHKDSALG
ncbi:hypothetical protein [Sphingobium chungbukense]|uniref:Uncharacterized protein n=1 Tax=Sphingobium chungbukense TaxID=56193 RepID=A0A0M3AQL7_9SPHN|nr:hypothetical protein [Sphingobium chungbukense]KKW91201.1 hypothetical protein YP76_16655 [Sphingobium chungbukense]